MNNAIYNIIYSKLIQWLTPKLIRKAKLMAWLGIVITPVQFLYQDLLRFRTQKVYELGITPQVCYLKKLLNDRYDVADRRIIIEDAIEQDPVYLFKRSESKPKYFYKRSENNPVTFYTRGESGGLRNDFVVKVPGAIVFPMAEMKSLVQSYKLAGKKFAIQIV
jgi:hypothetical protein